MKYIVLQVPGSLPREFPILFPEALVHKDVADCLKCRMPELHKAVVVSAGFISSLAIDKGCYGKSESLGVDSRGELDDRLLRMIDYTHGLV